MIKKGFTLLEILVVVSIFAVLGVLVTRALILSVGGSRKSESIVRVRENLDYSIGIIERQIRNAKTINPCPNDGIVLSYEDQYGSTSTFSCNPGNPGYIASGSARLTSTNVNITACTLTCEPSPGFGPSVVTISLRAKDTTAAGAQNSEISITQEVSLRNY